MMEVTFQSSQIATLSGMTNFQKKSFEELFFQTARSNHLPEIIYLSCLSKGFPLKDSFLNYYIHKEKSDEFRTLCEFADIHFNELTIQNIILKELRDKNFVQSLLELTCDPICDTSISDVMNKCFQINDFDEVIRAALRREIYMSRGTRMENGIINKLASSLAENKKVNNCDFTIKVTRCSEKMKRELLPFLPDEKGNINKIFIVGKTDVHYEVSDAKDELMPKVFYGEIKNRISNNKWPTSIDNQLQVMFYMFLYETEMMILISHYPDGSIDRNMIKWDDTLFEKASSELKKFACCYFDNIRKIKKTMTDNKRDEEPSEEERGAISVFMKAQISKRKDEIQRGIKHTIKLL